jgi:hypothetical protein
MTYENNNLLLIDFISSEMSLKVNPWGGTQSKEILVKSNLVKKETSYLVLTILMWWLRALGLP